MSTNGVSIRFSRCCLVTTLATVCRLTVVGVVAATLHTMHSLATLCRLTAVAAEVDWIRRVLWHWSAADFRIFHSPRSGVCTCLPPTERLRVLRTTTERHWAPACVCPTTERHTG